MSGETASLEENIGAVAIELTQDLREIDTAASELGLKKQDTPKRWIAGRVCELFSGTITSQGRFQSALMTLDYSK